MQLEELFEYKNRLIQDLLTNESIVKLINEEYNLDTAPKLVYSQVFPYEYIPDTLDDGHTYICIDVDVKRVYNKTYLDAIIYVWVMSHRSRLRLPEGGARPDRICIEINKAINGSRYYGLGELDLKSVQRFAPLTDYQGKVMVFEATEFNRTSPSGKPIPSNRRNG